MKKIVICCLFILLVGCGETKSKQSIHQDTKPIGENAEELLKKETILPISYQKGVFRMYDVAIGEKVESVKKKWGKENKKTEVKDDWRYNEIITYQKEKTQIDVALFRGSVEEITVTIPAHKNIVWDSFLSSFDGNVYEATEKGIKKEEGVKQIHYYVEPNKKQWIVAKEKENGEVILSYTYPYDLDMLSKQGFLIKK